MFNFYGLEALQSTLYLFIQTRIANTFLGKLKSQSRNFNIRN